MLLVPIIDFRIIITDSFLIVKSDFTMFFGTTSGAPTGRGIDFYRSLIYNQFVNIIYKEGRNYEENV